MQLNFFTVFVPTHCAGLSCTEMQQILNAQTANKLQVTNPRLSTEEKRGEKKNILFSEERYLILYCFQSLSQDQNLIPSSVFIGILNICFPLYSIY